MNKQLYLHKKIAFVFLFCLLFSPFITFAETTKSAQRKSASQPKREFALRDFTFTDTSLKAVINNIAELEAINVLFEDGISRIVETKKITFIVKGVSAPRALEMILLSERLSYAPIDKKTIVIFTEAQANKQRYEKMMVRAFYIKYADINEVRNVLQAALGIKQLVPLKDIRAIVVRDEEETIKLAEEIIARVDKPQHKFTFDVNIYEVNSQTSIQLTNPSGTLSTKDLKGSLKLIGSTKVHAAENEQVVLSTAIRIPNEYQKNLAISDDEQKTDATEQKKQNSETRRNAEVSLNLEMASTVEADYLKVRMQVTLRTADITPGVVFNTSIKELVSIKEGETKVIASTFSSAGETSTALDRKGNNPNFIVTITPHVIQKPVITASDQISVGPNGTATSFGITPSLEEFLTKAEQEPQK